MQLTVIDWNLDGFTGIDAKLQLLGELPWEVCLLQEVTSSSWPRLRELGEEACWSGDHLPPLSTEPRYRSAIVFRGGWRLRDPGVLEQVPSPERTAVATLERDGRVLTVASLALPPGVSWGDAGKGRQADRIACWLRERTAPVLIGIDANTPKWDRPALVDCEWWNDQERLLLGEDRIHDLRDLYREALDADPARRAQALAEAPTGPLATSHVRGRGERKVACRYDHLLASPELQVEQIEYLWDEAVDAGSDHALLTARVHLGASVAV